jgi:hypothetical protein
MELVQAVEFPYYLYPRALWERELVWLKTIGVRTVQFSIPWNWHQTGPAEFDFDGRTSPRRDLAGLIRALRKLDLRAWIRPLPPVSGWRNGGAPATGSDARAQRAWLRQLERLLTTQTARHGGPVAYVEGRVLAIDAASPPPRVALISAKDPNALARSREALGAAAGASSAAILWTDVEDALFPSGWSDSLTILRKGAVGLGGEEQPTISALRRSAALLRNWMPLFPGLRSVTPPETPGGKLPQSVSVMQLTSPLASVVSITNRGTQPFRDDLHVVDRGSRRRLVIPGVHVQPGDSLWLPVGLSLGPGSLCRECTNFSVAEHVVYATAELLSIEFENGILALEFAAPQPGEVAVQLARKPVGPYLAAGKPTEFDWDEKALRARFPIPAGAAPEYRVRIGIAIEEPDTSAFFNDTRRLIIGAKNVVSTTYSSAEVARRSRLRLPEGFTATPKTKSPNELDYEIQVPADRLHGDWVNLGLEADGMLLGRARVQLLRRASVRMSQAMELHFGQTALTPDPPIAPVEPRAGGNLELVIRNNDTAIRTFVLEAAGEGLEFFPPKTEISIAGTEERRVSLRVFGAEEVTGLREWRLRVSGAATLDLPMRVLLVPRGRTVAWSADLDGDGSAEWVVESQRVRAVFSGQDGGRWMEFSWKDSNKNFLPENGVFASPGPVEVRADGDSLEFTGKNWKRTARLSQNALTVEQTTPLPGDGLTSQKSGNLSLTVARPSASQTVYTLR